MHKLLRYEHISSDNLFWLKNRERGYIPAVEEYYLQKIDNTLPLFISVFSYCGLNNCVNHIETCWRDEYEY